MTSSVSVDLKRTAKTVDLALAQVQSTVELLDAGNTVPFITRYRKDQTGGLDEEQIQHVAAEVERQRQLEQRKQTILRSIETQGKLTESLARQIRTAENTKRLEDLYLPYRPKKQTLATQARERGLGLLADEILAAALSCSDLEGRAADFVNPDKEVTSAADALLGAGHVLAEKFSERADVRQKARKIFRHTGRMVSSRGEAEEKSIKQFHDYLEFQQPLGRIPPHRVLAINRGERAKALRVKIEADADQIQKDVTALVVATDHPHGEFLGGCVADALARLVVPSLEREARRELTEKAEARAIDVFAKNLGNLLLQPPVRGRRVLAVDPGFKNGCKLAALDEFGSVLAIDVVYLIGKEERKAKARTKLVELIRGHALTVVAVGNGTACRETEELIGELIAGELADCGVAYVVVNEAGASVYSTSAVGREEFPDHDAMQRSAISIGRRLQDPLSELVKIDPASIGVGLYQHDAKAKHLRSSLDGVVQSCVSYVGVDLNTASPSLLRYVSGLNQLTARRLYDHRCEHGPFQSREQLRDVPGFGDATFIQAAGFLKIATGDNPLDTTWIHPESYEAAEKLLTKLGHEAADLGDKEKVAHLAEQTAQLDRAALAEELGVGQLLLADMIEALSRPGRDPREDLPPPLFRKGVVKLDDLEQGMELAGSVLNVVDFGAFVDIGLSDSGLVHVSQMANRFIRDPHEVVSVGDTVKVWVTGVDKQRRRVALTMIEPGTEISPEDRKKNARRGKPKSRGKKPDAASRDGKPRENKGKQGSANRGTHKKPAARPRRPKPPAPPITDGMIQGNEPMRTFGDLLQFQQKKSHEDDEKKS